MSSYFDYQSRKTRPREQVRDDIAPEPQIQDEPIEVQEDVLSQTGVIKFLRRIAGRDR